MRVCHHVEHTFITVVTYSRDYGQREIGHILCQKQGVEARKVARCTSAADDNNGIEVVDAAVNGIEGGYDASKPSPCITAGKRTVLKA